MYVYSTLSNDQCYTKYRTGENDIPVVESQILIKGGTNVAQGQETRLFTPMGVATKVTEEELAILKDNPVFRQHEANGFIKYDSRNVNPEKIAATMVTRDKSAPMVPEDFGDDDRAKPKLEKPKKAA